MREPVSWRSRWRAVAVMAVACFRADPLRSWLSVALRATAGLAPPVFAAALASLVDSARPGVPASRSLVAAGVLAVAVAANSMLEELGWKVSQALEERTSHLVDVEIMGLVSGLPGLEHLERPGHLDKIDGIRTEQWLLSMSIHALITSAVVALQIGVTVVLLGGVHPVLLTVPLFAIPSLVAGAKAERIRWRVVEANRSDWRRVEDLLRLATNPGPAKEIRVFGLGPELLRRQRRVSRGMERWERDHRLVGAALISAGRAVFAVGYVGAIGFVAQRVVAGELTLRDLVLTAVLAGQVMASLAHATNTANWTAWTFTAVRRYLWLLDYAAESHHQGGGQGLPPPAVLRNGITLEGVSFRYPGTDVDVLREVDLFLPAGSTVAVVGDNGAGKTTLAKVLARFYEPTEGRVTLDGVDLAHVDVARWRERVSAAFQEPARLELLAGEAVGVGDVPRLDNEGAARAGLERAGSTDVLGALPRGLATQLGAEWPAGVDLSGGQWQKLALGRGMMRLVPLLLVLDEPTAALDAESEHRLFDRYASAAREGATKAGTITVLVSHRFSTVRMADLIVVISDGRIVERGTHDQLVAAGGRYAELYGMQARAYR